MAEIQNTYFIKKDSLTAIGDAIRSKLNDSDSVKYTVAEMPGKIEAISGGTVKQGSATTPPTTISVTPYITVSSSGAIIVSGSSYKDITPTVEAGYVTAGNQGRVTASVYSTAQLNSNYDPDFIKENIKKDITIFGVTGTYEGNGANLRSGGGTIELTSSNTTSKTQTFYPGSSYDGFSSFTATAKVTDANLVASNIKSGVTILGVTGSHKGAPYTAYANLTEAEKSQNVQVANLIQSSNITPPYCEGYTADGTQLIIRGRPVPDAINNRIIAAINPTTIIPATSTTDGVYKVSCVYYGSSIAGSAGSASTQFEATSKYAIYQN